MPSGTSWTALPGVWVPTDRPPYLFALWEMTCWKSLLSTHAVWTHLNLSQTKLTPNFWTVLQLSRSDLSYFLCVPLHLLSSVVIGVGKACDRSGLQLLHGDRWDDGCNSCQCMNGNIKCTKVSPMIYLRLCYCTNLILQSNCSHIQCKMLLLEGVKKIKMHLTNLKYQSHQHNFFCIKKMTPPCSSMNYFIRYLFLSMYRFFITFFIFYCDRRCFVVVSPACCRQTLVSHSAPCVH